MGIVGGGDSVSFMAKFLYRQGKNTHYIIMGQYHFVGISGVDTDIVNDLLIEKRD